MPQLKIFYIELLFSRIHKSVPKLNTSLEMLKEQQGRKEMWFLTLLAITCEVHEGGLFHQFNSSYCLPTFPRMPLTENGCELAAFSCELHTGAGSNRVSYNDCSGRARGPPVQQKCESSPRLRTRLGAALHVASQRLRTHFISACSLMYFSLCNCWMLLQNDKGGHKSFDSEGLTRKPDTYCWCKDGCKIKKKKKNHHSCEGNIQRSASAQVSAGNK